MQLQYKNQVTMAIRMLHFCHTNTRMSYKYSIVSDAYADSTSNRQRCERSDLMSKSLFSSENSIVADRGFNVQDLFAAKDVHVNIPSFFKGKSQFIAAEVVKDLRIASKRIHIERVIGLAKTFKILKQPLPKVYCTQSVCGVLICGYFTSS